MCGLIARFVVGALELPGEKRAQIFGGRPRLFAHVIAAVVEGRIDEPLDAMDIEPTKTSREVTEAEHRVASNHRIAVTRESRTAVFREFSIAALGREFENPVHQLDRVIPLERGLRNPSFVQRRESPFQAAPVRADQNSAEPGTRGTGITSRMFAIPVMN
jgi:hypothetical protein